MGTAFIGFGIYAVGFSASLLLDVYQLRVLQFPQRVYRLLPPAMEQPDHLADGIVQVNAPVLVSPAILAGEVCPAQDKGVQQLCFVRQHLIGECFKQEIGELGKAPRFLLLMDINGFCHGIFVDG